MHLEKNYYNVRISNQSLLSIICLLSFKVSCEWLWIQDSDFFTSSVFILSTFSMWKWTLKIISISVTTYVVVSFSLYVNDLSKWALKDVTIWGGCIFNLDVILIGLVSLYWPSDIMLQWGFTLTTVDASVLILLLLISLCKSVLFSRMFVLLHCPYLYFLGI
jgi:hypothetical protein